MRVVAVGLVFSGFLSSCLSRRLRVVALDLGASMRTKQKRLSWGGVVLFYSTFVPRFSSSKGGSGGISGKAEKMP